MTGIGFNVDIRGIESYIYKLGKLQERLPRAKDFWQYITDDFHVIEERTWAEGQSEWADWSPAYRAWRGGGRASTGGGRHRGRFVSRTTFASDEILVYTGALREDMTQRTLYGPTSGGVRLGTRQSYARYHMEGVGVMGGWARGAHMPARPFMGVTESDKRRWRRAREYWMLYQVWKSELGGSARWDMQRRIQGD